jgi:osmotically-inducible protein OsmY
MRTDTQICTDVAEELRWTPHVDDTDIAVNVTNGVVALAGFVKSLDDRCSAERAVKRIAGVRALANDLQIRVNSGDRRSDPDIARSAATALEHELPYTAHRVRIVVEHCQVTLEGVVDWQYQKERAEQAMRALKGITGVTNRLVLEGRPINADIKAQIGAALRRSADVDANRINVAIEGTEVTLTGRVKSWSEHELAADTAWSAPGVMIVKNLICVGP